MRNALVALIFALAALGPAAAHDPKDPRHKAMSGLGDAMKSLTAVAKGDAGFDSTARAAARTLQSTAERMPALFRTRSIPHGSRAKPAIWQQWDDFIAKAGDMRLAGAALEVAVDSGDLRVLRGTLRRAVETCGACHKLYRTPKT